jgi:hypothetical protein
MVCVLVVVESTLGKCQQDGWSSFGMTMMVKPKRSDTDSIDRENVFIPFLNNIRKEYNGWVEKSTIEDKSTIVSWQDGDFAQVATLTKDECLATLGALKVLINKQNPARSATEQAADLVKVFKLKCLQKLAQGRTLYMARLQTEC